MIIMLFFIKRSIYEFLIHSRDFKLRKRGLHKTGIELSDSELRITIHFLYYPNQK